MSHSVFYKFSNKQLCYSQLNLLFFFMSMYLFVDFEFKWFKDIELPFISHHSFDYIGIYKFIFFEIFYRRYFLHSPNAIFFSSSVIVLDCDCWMKENKIVPLKNECIGIEMLNVINWVYNELRFFSIFTSSFNSTNELMFGRLHNCKYFLNLKYSYWHFILKKRKFSLFKFPEYLRCGSRRYSQPLPSILSSL